MTKKEALKAMGQGKKVTHHLFSNEEFIYMVGLNIFDEKDYIMRDFWRYRTGDVWSEGWSIYELKKSHN